MRSIKRSAAESREPSGQSLGIDLGSDVDLVTGRIEEAQAADSGTTGHEVGPHGRLIEPERAGNSDPGDHDPAPFERFSHLLSSMHPQAAVDMQHLTGHVRRLFGEQEGDDIGDFLRRSEPPQRNREFLAGLLGQRVGHVGVDKPR